MELLIVLGMPCFVLLSLMVYFGIRMIDAHIALLELLLQEIASEMRTTNKQKSEELNII